MRQVHVKIKPKPNESIQQLVKRFRKLVDKDGVTQELRQRAYYQKPSEIKSRARMHKVYSIEKARQEEVRMEQRRRNYYQAMVNLGQSDTLGENGEN